MKCFAKFLTGLIISVLIFLLFKTPILTAYAKWFSVNNATKGADAIVVLAGSMKNRLTETVAAIDAGYSPMALITDVRMETDLYPELIMGWTKIADTIFKLEGIPHVFVPSIKGPKGKGATSTFDEAYDIAAYCQKNNLKRIIILTDAFHTRRARFCFRKVFKILNLDTEVEVMGSENKIYSENNWWTTEDGLQQYVLEPIKLVIYNLRSKNLTIIEEG